jgi:hypothetical protein
VTLYFNGGHAIGFGNNPIAERSDVQQRMALVLKAAALFDELLRRSDRHLIERARYRHKVE